MKTGKSLLEYLEERNMLPYPGGQVREIYIRISREADPYLLNILQVFTPPSSNLTSYSIFKHRFQVHNLF